MSITRDDTLNWVKAIASAINENTTYLTELDAAIGDADHGANMDRGFKAVMNKLPEISDKDIGAIFKTVGMKTAGKMEPSLTDWADALEAALNGVDMRGKAELGDKTMVDAIAPAVAVLKQSVPESQPIHKARELSAEAVTKGREGTVSLMVCKGRASYLGERSAGHQDPGATSSFLILKAASDTWKNVAA